MGNRGRKRGSMQEENIAMTYRRSSSATGATTQESSNGRIIFYTTDIAATNDAQSSLCRLNISWSTTRKFVITQEKGFSFSRSRRWFPDSMAGFKMCVRVQFGMYEQMRFRQPTMNNQQI